MPQTRSQAKGKGKAQAPDPGAAAGHAERAPLMSARRPSDANYGAADSDDDGSSTYSAEFTVDTPATGHVHRRVRRFTFVIILLSLVMGVVMFTAVLALSFVPSDSQVEKLPHSFQYDRPSVNVLNVSEDGVHINVSFLGGVDVNRALVLKNPEDEWVGARLWAAVRRATAHGAVGALPKPAVQVIIPEILVCPPGGGLPLLNITLPDAITVPLITESGALVPISVEAIGAPVAPASEVWSWLQGAWALGHANIVLAMREAHASVPGAWWSKYAYVNQEDVAVNVAVRALTGVVPRLPNLPPPGQPLNLSELVVLHSYAFRTDDGGLRISGTASAPNPGLVSVPFGLPFAILLDGVGIAEVVSHVSSIDEHEIHLAIDGDIDVERAAAGKASPLSHFLQNYLHGDPNPIFVRGLNHMRGARGVPAPPEWVLRTLPSLALDMTFPAPTPKPHIVRTVSIEHMKFFEVAGTMHASGVVVATVDLPRGIEDVAINVTAIRPDILVYDGPAGDDAEAGAGAGAFAGAGSNDTEPYPPRAFARIHPDEFIPSATFPADDPSAPHVRVVRAPFDDLALDILPGRDGVLRSFVAKVIWKGGATAGLDGTTAIQVALPGVKGVLGVSDLPVRGEFFVRR